MSLKVHRNSTQRRNDSGELDVFEATKYFSSYNEVSAYNGGYFPQKAMREERQALGGRRMSLDVHTTSSLPSQSQRVDKQMKEKKQKLPSSPGGRLASFLNSLFNQAASKKKKSKGNTTQSVKDEEESPSAGRRKRRSSMSLFQSINNDSKSLYLSSNASGFRTPPPYVDTPIKVYKDLRSYSDHKHVVSLPKYTRNVRSVTSEDEALGEKKNMDLAWLDEKFSFIDSFSEKNKDRTWISSEKKNVKMSTDQVDDGGESDSSSDLFELENYDLGSYSSDLPVYETTHMESIRRGPPISTGPL